ncbi:MAG: NAD(P)H-quinone oxidoreductase [Thermoanaerobaculia bacterium]
MRAVLPWTPGSPPAPRIGEASDPRPGPGEVLIEIHATALNRADLLQMQGRYPPPVGESEIPGLEAAGEIVALGAGVEGFRIGDRVGALLAGGGHAERAAAPAGQLIPIPANWTWEEAGALPEAAITAWTNLVVEGGLQPGECVAVTGAASGIGTFAIPLARELGARVFAVGRDPDRLERTRALGAERVFVEGESLPGDLRAATEGRGVDLVLDLVGGERISGLLAALAPRGRLVLLSLLAGSSVEVDLARLLRGRLRLIGSVLRSRTRAEKGELVAGFRQFADGLLRERRLLPLLDRVFPFAEIATAYEHLAHGRPLGKVGVRVR